MNAGFHDCNAGLQSNSPVLDDAMGAVTMLALVDEALNTGTPEIADTGGRVPRARGGEKRGSHGKQPV